MVVDVIVFQGTVFGGVGAPASAADVCDFSAVGGDMLSIDGVALVASTGFGEKFACGAAFAEDIEVVVDRFVRVLGCAESDDHEGGTLSFEVSFYWFYPAGKGDNRCCWFSTLVYSNCYQHEVYCSQHLLFLQLL
jgi:hypothetical protein